MDNKSKFVCKTSKIHNLVERTWCDDDLGLRKDCLLYEYNGMTKASDCSKCFVRISNVENLHDYPSNYLTCNEDELFSIEIGAAEYPVDIYVEQFLLNMMVGERSKCTIRTKSNVNINFIILVQEINFCGYLYEWTRNDLFVYAKRLKECGVKMFKKWPKFAHNNFNRAFKCLHTLKPFSSEINEKVTSNELQQLYVNLLSNISACLLIEHRYEDVLDVLTEIDNDDDCMQMEKIRFRRASAYFHLKQFDEAKEELEKVQNFRETKDIMMLYDKIINEMKKYNETYTSMVKKMFG